MISNTLRRGELRDRKASSTHIHGLDRSAESAQMKTHDETCERADCDDDAADLSDLCEIWHLHYHNTNRVHQVMATPIQLTVQVFRIPFACT